MKIQRSILFTIIGLFALLAAMAGVKGLQIGKMVAQGKTVVPPPQTVTASNAAEQKWESVLTAIGSLEAARGIMVTGELPGKITQIAFQSGGRIRAGELLLQQDISTELAQQRAAESDLELARKSLLRGQSLLPAKVISQSDFEMLNTQYEKAVANLDAIRSAIAKKTITSPFDARLGIRQVNVGEILAAGQPIVSLQALDPIHVNFLLPQNQLPEIRVGMPVRVTTDNMTGKNVAGTITAINAEVERTTRNIRIQATIENPDERLHPGMYVNVAVVLPDKNTVIAIPATAVLYAPYSDSVFVIEKKNDTSGDPAKYVRQQFIKLGKRYGDFVAVMSGLTPGDTIVSTGAFKLRNGQTVVINNTHAPDFQLAPKPDNA